MYACGMFILLLLGNQYLNKAKEILKGQEGTFIACQASSAHKLTLWNVIHREPATFSTMAGWMSQYERDAIKAQQVYLPVHTIFRSFLGSLLLMLPNQLIV